MKPELFGLPDYRKTPGLSGASLLGLVTTGMYSDPMSIYREYIQNAADIAATNKTPRVLQVEIALDVDNRQIRIRDSGPGLSFDEALERLLPIGRSDKTLGADRGFRGIGRLGGLAFAKTVSFTTRTHGKEPATRITWHSDKLPDHASTALELEQAILDCVDVERLLESDFPEHFFDVEIADVARHAAGLLLNRDTVREYVSEVCPVPMSTKFPFTQKVEDLFKGTDAPFKLEVFLEGDKTPLERPYSESIVFSANKEAEFTDFQEVRVQNIDGNGEAAVGWIAHSSYLGAIPKNQRVRGIRARVGNIQVGSEAVFDGLFVEERFNRWCVGELHILEPRIVPNSRRDYFQLGPHLRNLENQLGPVVRDISTRCRRESTARNRARKTMATLSKIEDTYTLATSGYLSTKDSTGLVQEALREVSELRNSVKSDTLDTSILKRLSSADNNLTNYSADDAQNPYGDLSHTEIAVYQRVFGALSSFADSPRSTKELIESVLTQASRVSQNGSASGADSKHEDRSQPRLALGNSGTLIPSPNQP